MIDAEPVPEWMVEMAKEAGIFDDDLIELRAKAETECGKLNALIKAADTILSKREARAYIAESTEAGLRKMVEEVVGKTNR